MSGEIPNDSTLEPVTTAGWYGCRDGQWRWCTVINGCARTVGPARARPPTDEEADAELARDELEQAAWRAGRERVTTWVCEP